MKKLGMLNVFILLIFLSCKDENENSGPGLNRIDFRQEMREFVIEVSVYSKGINPAFNIIPQNGIELVSTTGDDDGEPYLEYLDAIDGNGQEDLLYGYNEDNQASPASETGYLQNLLTIAQNAGNVILVTDYCSTPSKMDDSYNRNNTNGYISFSANHRELDIIPAYPDPIYAENSETLNTLSEVKNFLYLINPANFNTKTDFIDAIVDTNYDLLIMDLFFNDGSAFTHSQIKQLKNKKNGGNRLVICYMSIGEAEDYRYYWDNDWENNKPDWMDEENPDWQGNYKVKYWNEEWQSIIFGHDSSYLKKVLDAGFDGVYLDIIDAFEYYEQ